MHPNRVALIHGAWRSTWAQTYVRCRRLASALAKHGVGPGDTVAVMAPNVPAMYEAHFGVPMTGAVLNTLNIRLDAEADRLPAHPRRSQSAHHRPRIQRRRETRTGHAGAPAVGDRHRRSRCTKAARCWVEMDYEAFLRRRRSRFRLVAPGRRIWPDRPELHLGHDGQPEGCRHAPSRRVPERHLPDRFLGNAGALGLSLDAADVPLQRLVLSLGDGGQCRHQHLSAAGGRRS